MQKAAVLVVAEDRELRAVLVSTLRASNCVELEHDCEPDLICLGCAERIPLKDLKALRNLGGEKKIPIVLMTCRGSEELAVQAFREGVSEYLRVPFFPQEFELLVKRLCCARENPSGESECVIRESPAMQRVRAYVDKVARTASNVLITGETGTGKELIAELIHRKSARSQRPLVCVNCAAIPDTLLESELFGYERGAFTGAHVSNEGKLKLADKGTLFLDEIADMSPYAQAKVLRVIESREIQKLGGHKTQSVDFRLICATNCDLETAARDGRFRRDLFFRLNVGRIHLPPLRERKMDILPLANFFRQQNDQRFAQQTAGFTSAAEATLLNHDWPGNVRELKNVIEAAFISLDAGATLVPLPLLFCDAVGRREEIGAAELDRILLALSETHWNKTQAAEKLNWSRMTLYRKMSQYQISAPVRQFSSGMSDTGQSELAKRSVTHLPVGSLPFKP
jgi:DNA-binding NtrC family response regulator